MIEVLKPGAASSLQDLGRLGSQRFGVITSGVMDEWSHRVANLLVANTDDQATLEITLIGPSLRFSKDTLIAIVGADLSWTLDGQPMPLAEPLLVKAGTRLDAGAPRFGCRAYLAVHGGFSVEPVMGSRSTYLRAGFGGFQGRLLRKGDRLPVGEGDPRRMFPNQARRLRGPGGGFVSAAGAGPLVLPHPGHQAGPLRVIEGQQWGRFSDEAHGRLDSASYTVGLNSDRMGYRLEGPGLTLREPLEMISEAVAFGSVQVPPDGQPIILLADRQTTGGYPKIASVASVDLPRLAQMAPGQKLRFSRVSLDEAQYRYLDREREFARLRSRIDILRGQD